MHSDRLSNVVRYVQIDGNSGSGNGDSGNVGSALAVDQSLVALMVSSAVWEVAQDFAAQA